MNPGVSSPPGPHGRPVDEAEELHRCITQRNWWVEEEKRVSSAAFSYPVFSVDVASLAKSPEMTLSRFLPGTGLVAFSCRLARELGYDPRHEVDPNYPGNLAHANVYAPIGHRRKSAAKKLAEACTKNVLQIPRFEE